MIKSATFAKGVVKTDFADRIESTIPNQSPGFNTPSTAIKSK